MVDRRLATYRRIVDEVSHYCSRWSSCLKSADMGKAVAELFVRAGDYKTTAIYLDYTSKDRVIAATKMARPDDPSFSRG
jgi:hypothetical protein